MVREQYRIRIRHGEFEIEVEGDKDFVERHIKKLRKEVPETPERLLTTEGITVKEASKGELALERFSLVEFYRQKQPKSHNERVLVFAYWLAKKKGMEEFRVEDILACYDEVRIPKPSNPRDGLSKGKEKGYFMPGRQRGLHRLTLGGEEFVEQELPRGSDV